MTLPNTTSAGADNDQPHTSAAAAETTSHDITDAVIETLSRATDTRLGRILPILVRYVHDFAREVGLTPQELFASAEFLTACGQISTPSRHEFLLLSDTLGLTMVVDTLATPADAGAFESSVLGPFYREGAPHYPAGADISRGRVDGEPVHVRATVVAGDGSPISGATLDVWGTNAEGHYENVDPNQPDMNLRGRFSTDQDGHVDFHTVRPVSYPVPDDGPAGKLLYASKRHNMRPAHLHVIASAPGYATVISELYSSGDPYLDSDAVFGVKPSLIVDYTPADHHTPDAPAWVLHHQFVLTAGQTSAVHFSAGTEANTDTNTDNNSNTHTDTGATEDFDQEEPLEY